VQRRIDETVKIKQEVSDFFLASCGVVIVFAALTGRSAFPFELQSLKFVLK